MGLGGHVTVNVNDELPGEKDSLYLRHWVGEVTSLCVDIVMRFLSFEKGYNRSCVCVTVMCVLSFGKGYNVAAFLSYFTYCSLFRKREASMLHIFCFIIQKVSISRVSFFYFRHQSCAYYIPFSRISGNLHGICLAEIQAGCVLSFDSNHSNLFPLRSVFFFFNIFLHYTGEILVKRIFKSDLKPLGPGGCADKQTALSDEDSCVAGSQDPEESRALADSPSSKAVIGVREGGGVGGREVRQEQGQEVSKQSLQDKERMSHLVSSKCFWPSVFTSTTSRPTHPVAFKPLSRRTQDGSWHHLRVTEKPEVAGRRDRIWRL